MSEAKTNTDKVKRERERIVTTLELALENFQEATEMVKTGNDEQIRAAALIWKDSANSLTRLYSRVRGSEGFGQK